MADNLANEFSRTLSLSNRYLMMLVEQSGLKGLSPSHGEILVELFAGKPVAMSELSRRIGRDPSTITALVKKLVGMGLAQTAKRPDDRRSTMVTLTDRAKGLQADFEAISERLMAAWHEGIDPADLEVTKRVLATVRGNLAKEIGREEARALESASRAS